MKGAFLQLNMTANTGLLMLSVCVIIATYI